MSRLDALKKKQKEAEEKNFIEQESNILAEESPVDEYLNNIINISTDSDTEPDIETDDKPDIKPVITLSDIKTDTVISEPVEGMEQVDVLNAPRPELKIYEYNIEAAAYVFSAFLKPETVYKLVTKSFEYDVKKYALINSIVQCEREYLKNYSDYITPEFKVSNIKNRRDTRSQMTEHFSARFSKDNIAFIKEESRKCCMYCNAYLEFIINKYI